MEVKGSDTCFFGPGPAATFLGRVDISPHLGGGLVSVDNNRLGGSIVSCAMLPSLTATLIPAAGVSVKATDARVGAASEQTEEKCFSGANLIRLSAERGFGMTVFISHDFKDKALFDNITDALEQAGIKYYNPHEMTMAGLLLSDQLRQAFIQSDVCVFIATNNSINSAWCGAELGAFWGSGKRVIIFLADSNLDESNLPKQFQGHVAERRTRRLVDNVKQYLAEKNSTEHQVGQENAQQLNVADLRDLIESAFARALRINHLRATFGEISEVISHEISTLDERQKISLRAILSRLLGRTSNEISETAAEALRFSFFVDTSTGRWKGYAQEQRISGPDHAPDVVVQYRCALLHFDQWNKVIAAAIVESVIEGHNWGVTSTKITDPIVIVGRTHLGVAVSDQHF